MPKYIKKRSVHYDKYAINRVITKQYYRESMPQLSKLIKSREDWKRKSIQRASENREYRKQTKRYRKKIAELKAQVRDLKSISTDKKKSAIQD